MVVLVGLLTKEPFHENVQRHIHLSRLYNQNNARLRKGRVDKNSRR